MVCYSLSRRSGFAALAIVALAATAPVSADHGSAPTTTLTVKMRDTCNPDSFNVAFGPGTCLPSVFTNPLGTTVEALIQELTEDQTAGSWRFHPALARLGRRENTQLMITNLGGETHTFTEVKEFGGGFVALLNNLSGSPTPAPECAQVVNGELAPQPPSASNLFVPAGQTVPGPVIDNGRTRKFMCCIHPWMRMAVNPRGRAEGALANPK